MPSSSSPTQLTEPQALTMLRKYARVQWGLTLVASLMAGLGLAVFHRFVRDDGWSDALLYGALVAAGVWLVQLGLEWRRVRSLPDTSSWTSLDRAQVVSRDGTTVTLRGRGGTLSAPVRQAWTLQPDDVVWVGPALREGERLVLVRPGLSVTASPLVVAFEPARRV